MMPFEYLRKILFWTVDFLKGGQHRKHYLDIRCIQENFKSAEASKTRGAYLKNLLVHAISTVPYYQNLKERFLSVFPVVNKSVIRVNFTSFQSSGYTSKKNHTVRTSGSTGIPFTIFHDNNKRATNTMDAIYFGKKAGFEIGSRLFYLRLWDKQYMKSDFLSWIQNIYMHSVDELKDSEISKLVHRLKKDRSNKSILGYTSALQSICKYLDVHPEDASGFKVN